MLIAEPVMKPLTAGVGMNSTIHPSLSRPIPRTIKPQMKATAVAIVWGSHTSGCESVTCLTISAMVIDITATGPIDTSFEVAKNCTYSSELPHVMLQASF